MPHTAPLTPPTAPARAAAPGDDEVVPRPRTPREWRDALDDYRLPAGPDGWWAPGPPPASDAGRARG